MYANDKRRGRTRLSSNQPLTEGQWQHAAAYRYAANGNSVNRLYIDGEEVGRTDEAVGPLQSNRQSLNVGRYRWSRRYKRHFAGLIDEVYVFAAALDPDEIEALAEPALGP